MLDELSQNEKAGLLCWFAFIVAMFLPFLDAAVAVRYERWQISETCREHHFDFAVNTAASANYPYWECRVRGPISADGTGQTMAVPLELINEYELEALNFRRLGGNSK